MKKEGRHKNSLYLSFWTCTTFWVVHIICFLSFSFRPAAYSLSISVLSHIHTQTYTKVIFFFPPPLSFCVYIQFYFIFFSYRRLHWKILYYTLYCYYCNTLSLLDFQFFFFFFSPYYFWMDAVFVLDWLKKKIIVIFLPSEYESVCSTGLRMWFFVSFISESNLILYSFHLYSFPQNIFLSLVDTICNVSMIISFLCVCLHAKRRFEGCWEADCVLTMCAVCLFWT